MIREGIEFRKVFPGFEGIWHGFSFNPGLRRQKDYLKIGKYAKYSSEANISYKYNKENYYAIVLEQSAVKHIGSTQHIPRFLPEKFLASLKRKFLHFI